MSYADSRDAAQLDYLRIRTLQFIQRWHGRPAGAPRRTLFLLPGGLGSNLLKAKTKYLTQGPPIQKFGYDMIWLTLASFLGDALLSEMVWHAADQCYHDVDDKIVVADGSIELFGVDPYAGFVDWCEGEQLDWFTFGWDWRRPVSEAATFFAAKFLPMFQALVQAECGVDPLADFIVVGHSEGGMVLNAMLRDGALPAGLTAAVTVATPFYGYGGQMHRWFEGDEMFFLLDTMEVIRVISSLPGLYVLPFLDDATWARDGAALGQYTYPLTGYPSVGAKLPAVDVDPFVYSNTRYPTGTGFDQAALAAGLAEYTRLAAPMPGYAKIFTTVQGVRLNGSGTPVKKTKGGLTWGLLNPAKVYQPGNTPLKDSAKVPGDGTLPAWSTHLVGSPSVIVANREAEHMFLLEQPETQAALAKILGLAPKPAAQMTGAAIMTGPPHQPRDLASQADLDAFIRQIKLETEGATTPFAFRRKALAVFERQRTTKLKALFGRLIANIGRSPERPPARSAKPRKRR